MPCHEYQLILACWHCKDCSLYCVPKNSKNSTAAGFMVLDIDSRLARRLQLMLEMGFTFTMRRLQALHRFSQSTSNPMLISQESFALRLTASRSRVSQTLNLNCWIPHADMSKGWWNETYIDRHLLFQWAILFVNSVLWLPFCKPLCQYWQNEGMLLCMLVCTGSLRMLNSQMVCSSASHWWRRPMVHFFWWRALSIPRRSQSNLQSHLWEAPPSECPDFRREES